MDKWFCMRSALRGQSQEPHSCGSYKHNSSSCAVSAGLEMGEENEEMVCKEAADGMKF